MQSYTGPKKTDICFWVFFDHYFQNFISLGEICCRVCLDPVLKFFWYFLISKILILKPFGNCNLQLVRERAFKCILLDIKSSFICGDSGLYWNTVNYHNISTRVVDWIILKFLMCLFKYEPLFKKSLRKNDYIIKKLLNRYFWKC